MSVLCSSSSEWRMKTALPLFLVLTSLFSIHSLPAAEPTLLAPLDVWNGTLADSALRELAPENHVVLSAEDFARLWKAWRGEETQPKIDFSSHLVVVGVASGGNRVYLKPWLGDGGNLSVSVMSTKLPGPGFSYSLWRVRRDGIRSIDGTPLSK